MQAKEWPEKDVEKLKFLIKDGFSARQIGDRLGYSRDSVCGKAQRLGLSRGALRYGLHRETSYESR